MFVRRSRYNTLVKESEAQLDEIKGLRQELGKAMEAVAKKNTAIEQLHREAKKYASTIAEKSTEVKEAKKDSQRLEQLKRDLRVVDFDLKDYVHPAPKDPEQRALYVSRIAGYFNGGLQDIINYFLAGFRAEISRFPLSEREADFYRASINVCHLLNEWGDSMTQEHMANARGDEATQDAFDTLDNHESDEAVENIKRSVNT